MCGIAGFIGFNGMRFSSQHLYGMVNAMRRRGPDDEGYLLFPDSRSHGLIFGGPETLADTYAAECAYTPNESIAVVGNEHCEVALGHRRLAIIDCSPAGHQPMCSADRRFWIVYNGEIYNFREIRSELERSGAVFTSGSDTEVILQAYQYWGAGCVERFNGMWAFAIWDSRDRMLFCSRDRLGIKPFYYTVMAHGFLFASDIKTLIASGLYQPQPDWQAVYHAMSFYCAPRPMTCFKGVYALQQGHSLAIDLQGRMQLSKYWEVPLGGVDYARSEKDWEEELEDTLTRAVRRRLIADVPVSVFMSGGIDSTTVAALAAGDSPGIRAYTLGFDDPVLDEVREAAMVAERWQMQHNIRLLDRSFSRAELSARVRCYEEPFQGLSPTYAIAEMVAADGQKVVLSGLGGDELFFGYGREKLLQRWSLARRFKGLVNCLHGQGRTEEKLRTLASLEHLHEVYTFGFSTFSETEKKQLFAMNEAKEWDSYAAFDQLYGLKDKSFDDPIQAFCYFDIYNYVGNHHMYRNDQFLMNFSVEGRFPFLDHEMVELAFRMPSRYKLKKGCGKYLLRKVARKYIAQECLDMKKKGFSLPLDRWLRQDLKATLDEELNDLKSRDLFDPDRLDEMTNAFWAGKVSANKMIFLMSIELWLKEVLGDRP